MLGVFLPIITIKNMVRCKIASCPPKGIVLNDHHAFLIRLLRMEPYVIGFGWWHIISKTFGPVGATHSALCNPHHATGKYNKQGENQGKFYASLLPVNYKSNGVNKSFFFLSLFRRWNCILRHTKFYYLHFVLCHHLPHLILKGTLTNCR